VFLLDFGVAAGRAMMTTKHNLCETLHKFDGFIYDNKNNFLTHKTFRRMWSFCAETTECHIRQHSGHVDTTSSILAVMEVGGKRKKVNTYNSWAFVAVKLPPELILTAAITCSAHPQSIDATAEMDPIVFTSKREHLFRPPKCVKG